MIKQILCAAILVSLIQADAPGYNFDCGCAINLGYKLCDCSKASSKSACGTADNQQSCNCGCGTCDELCVGYACAMEAYCESCDYSGSETYAGSMTLEACKAACVADDSCYAIDYSKSGTNCYKNFGSVQQYGNSGGYDAWVKSCGASDCNGVLNGGATSDQCGVCGGDNACVDCNGVANGGATIDQCGVCGGDDACVDCNGVVNGGAALNDCGVCGGDNACVVDGIWIDSLSQLRYDTGFVCDNFFHHHDYTANVACKEAMGSTSYEATSYTTDVSLIGCNPDEGTPEHITLTNFDCYDKVSLSMEQCNYTLDFVNPLSCDCGEGVTITCVENPDCNGVANGGAVEDDCGVCEGDNSDVDDCGVCFGDNACVDCNGVANGGAVFDDCGECGGDGSSCACKNPTSCKGVTQEECEASPEVCETIIKKDVFKKCKPIKPLQCKSQETLEACEALCYCQPKMKNSGVFKKCKDKDPADY